MEMKQAKRQAKTKQSRRQNKKQEMSKKFDVSAGDIVQLTLKTGEKFKAIVMPKQIANVLLVKLDNGYNVGFGFDEIKSINKIGKIKLEQFPEKQVKQNEALVDVTFVMTGGTIASRVDYTTGAVSSLMKPSQLFSVIPGLEKVVNVKQVVMPFLELSENITAEHWKKLAKIIAEQKTKAVIVAHGTDTLHYTASALAFMLHDIPKVVVFVYAQRSSDRPSTDAVLNVLCAANFASYAVKNNINGVFVVGHASMNDDYCFVLPAVKTRKMHTSRRDTFRPINALPLAKVWPDKIEIVDSKALEFYKQEKHGKLHAHFNDKVALIKWHPNADPDIIHYYVKKNYKGIVIEATGFGHVCIKGKTSWLNALKKAIDNGIIVVFAAQTIYGRLNSYVYATARKISKLGVVYAEDMLSETAYVKLGWLLGMKLKQDKIKQLLLHNFAGEISNTSIINTFLY